MTLVGLVTSPFKVHVLETFVHYYLPSVFYFISRKFSSYSLSNFYRSVQLVRHLAIFFIVNMFIEWALYDFDMRHLVPWAGLGQDQEGLVKFSVEWYGLGFDRVGSVLTSTKTTEMVLASLFCFILPISFQKIEKQVNQYSKKLARPFQNFFLLVFMLICSIGISKLSNK